ncbi:MAG: SDR family oxidoreductase [Myxococcota bacterium]|nr:SDR family oxidoreductase [Myxococcota bacterium]MDW8363013.1 SDR family oxidoreductase [Myxococcales bacterium]
MGVLDGRVALVTGAGRGIGAAVAKRLAAEGAALVLVDHGCEPDGQGRDPAVVEAAARALRDAGARVETMDLDVSEPGASDAAVERALERFGRLDAAVGCAGIARERALLTTTDDDLHVLWSVMGASAFALVRAAARAMIESGRGGAIVLSTAPWALFGAPRQAAAGCVQAAIVGLVRCASLELRPHRVRLNAIAPTAHTRLTADGGPLASVNAAALGPEHVAEAILFLLSDAGSEVSGELLGVAGARVYAIRARESAGIVSASGSLRWDELAARWAEVGRG